VPASRKTRAEAQYDNALRGALPRTESPPVTGIRTAADEVMRGGGQAGRPDHRAWTPPGAAASSRIRRHSRGVWLSHAFSYISGQKLASGNARRPAGLAVIGNLSLASRPGAEEGRATKECSKR
jgi:hypothetical protein